MKFKFNTDTSAKLKEGVDKLQEIFNCKSNRYYKKNEINKFAFDNIEKFKERYEKKVIKNEEGCWGWVGARFNEYPIITYKVGIGAHRISYIIENGEIPDDKIIMHLCDNPICSNPKHLKLGETRENINYKYIMDKKKYNTNLEDNTIVRLSVDIQLGVHKEIRKLAADKNITIKKWVTRAIAEKMQKEKEYLGD